MLISSDEARLIAWVIGGQGHTMSKQVGETLMTDWKDLRKRVWEAILECRILADKIDVEVREGHREPPENPAEVEFPVEPQELEGILAIVPGMFAFSMDGPDIGFKLSLRIAEELWGVEVLDKFESREEVVQA